MATVRIYKVAELLGSTSQEVLALLKRDHGIELKSASSTIEEVVARSFVERIARQRGISLPSGDMRSKGDVDVNAIAKQFGGGGHKNASGGSATGKFEDLKLQFQRLLLQQIEAARKLQT